MMLRGMAAAAAMACAGAAQAVTLQVNPIQVCADDGTACAPVNYNTAFTDKIFAQTGTTVSFGPLRQLNSTRFLNPDQAAITALRTSAPDAGTERAAGAYDVWFVNVLDGRPGFRGVASLGGDGALIASTAAVDTLAHELGHNLGYAHVDDGIVDAGRYLLARGAVREIPTTVDDIAPDGRQLSRFEPILPEVTIDTIGATPFNSDDFFDVRFADGAATDLFLTALSIDLSPAGAFFDVTDADPGNSGSPFGYGLLRGITAGDIAVRGLTDGGSLLEMMFADGTFGSGDAISFGLDIDLFSNIDGFGATADELRATAVTLSFSNGYTTAGSLADLIFSSTFDPNRFVDVITLRTADPVAAPVIPLPGGAWLLMGGLAALLVVRRRRP